MHFVPMTSDPSASDLQANECPSDTRPCGGTCGKGYVANDTLSLVELDDSPESNIKRGELFTQLVPEEWHPRL
jgi:hypothetical protein